MIDDRIVERVGLFMVLKALEWSNWIGSAIVILLLILYT